MLRLAADENFDNNILRGLALRSSELNVIRAQDAGLAEAEDPAILAWAANEGRILPTHDVRTLIAFAYQRLSEGDPMLGVFVVPSLMPIDDAIQDLLLLAENTDPTEWDGQVLFLPLRP